jgi:uncharacterized FlgJ-related protein
MKLSHLTLAIALMGPLCLSKATLPAAAAGCPQVQSIIAPAKTTKEFHSRPLGIAFQIPENYRVMKLRNHAIAVMDPNTYKEMQCLQQKRILTDNIPDYVTIDTKRITAENKLAAVNLRDYVGKYYKVKKVEAITIAGQPAVKYVADGMNLYTAVSFLSGDRKTLVTISTHLDVAEASAFGSTFELILKTFLFK